MMSMLRKAGFAVALSILVSMLVSACNLQELVENAKKGNVDSATVVRLKAYAGTYPVTALRGAHARGTVVLGEDGSIDFDSTALFVLANYQGLVDTVVAGDTVGGYHFRVDIKPLNGHTLRRIKLYVDTTAQVLLKAAYYADALNKPDSAVVVRRVLP